MDKLWITFSLPERLQVAACCGHMSYQTTFLSSYELAALTGLSRRAILQAVIRKDLPPCDVESLDVAFWRATPALWAAIERLKKRAARPTYPHPKSP